MCDYKPVQHSVVKQEQAAGFKAGCGAVQVDLQQFLAYFGKVTKDMSTQDFQAMLKHMMAE